MVILIVSKEKLKTKKNLKTKNKKLKGKIPLSLYINYFSYF
jgi:hypothetical protein